MIESSLGSPLTSRHFGYAAASAVAGPVLVIAGAGTGGAAGDCLADLRVLPHLAGVAVEDVDVGGTWLCIRACPRAAPARPARPHPGRAGSRSPHGEDP